MKKCVQCGKELVDDARFCKYCLAQQPNTTNRLFCYQCGKELSIATNFCPFCGAKAGNIIHDSNYSEVKPIADNRVSKGSNSNGFLFFLRLLFVVIGLVMIVAGFMRIKKTLDKTKEEVSSVIENIPVVKTVNTATEVAGDDIVKKAAIQFLIKFFFTPQGISPEIISSEIEESDEYGRYIVSVIVDLDSYVGADFPQQEYLVYVYDVTEEHYAYNIDGIDFVTDGNTKEDIIEKMKTWFDFGKPFAESEIKETSEKDNKAIAVEESKTDNPLNYVITPEGKECYALPMENCNGEEVLFRDATMEIINIQHEYDIDATSCNKPSYSGILILNEPIQSEEIVLQFNLLDENDSIINHYFPNSDDYCLGEAYIHPIEGQKEYEIFFTMVVPWEEWNEAKKFALTGIKLN